MLEVFPPESYKRLRYLMDRGKGYRAPGPCAIPGCTYIKRGGRWATRDIPLSPPFVWDHCHLHDYVRGILCREHNGLLAPIDNQDHWHVAGLGRRADLAELLAYRNRCPHCAALGPWRPIMVRHTPAMVHRAAYLDEIQARYATRRASREAWEAQIRADAARRRASALKGVATRRARQATAAVALEAARQLADAPGRAAAELEL